MKRSQIKRYATLPFRLLAVGLAVVVVFMMVSTFKMLFGSFRCRECRRGFIGGHAGQRICPECNPTEKGDPLRPEALRDSAE